MGLTSAQRHNRMMDKIFADYKAIKKKESGMNYKELIADGYSKETARYIVLEKKLLKNKNVKKVTIAVRRKLK